MNPVSKSRKKRTLMKIPMLAMNAMVGSKETPSLFNTSAPTPRRDIMSAMSAKHTDRENTLFM